MPKEATIAQALAMMEKDWATYPHPVYIFEQWCKGCEICVALCPEGTLEMGRDKIAHVTHPETCTSCKLCELRCPDFCITVFPKKKKVAAVGSTS
jgi:2-oxoglutarate ferredoxin oxidoreductase subunit delta